MGEKLEISKIFVNKIGLYSIPDIENLQFNHTQYTPADSNLQPQNQNPITALEAKSSNQMMQDFQTSELPPENPIQKPSLFGIFGFQYWQTYFSLDQFDFKSRVLSSLNPTTPDFLNLIHQNPDLYGPFWIATFLIFLLDISNKFLPLIYHTIFGTSKKTLYNFENLDFAAF